GALSAGRDQDGRGGFRQCRRRRQGRRRRVVASDGPAAAVRSGRPGHPQADRGQNVRGIQGAALRPTAAVVAHGGSGSVGKEIGPGLLHLLKLSSCSNSRSGGAVDSIGYYFGVQSDERFGSAWLS